MDLIIIIMGVSGTGKTTIGRKLARTTGAEFLEGDDYHSPENVEKMRSGVPLTETDREPWLGALRKLVDQWRVSEKWAVLACSALTERSRRLLGVDQDGVELVFLNGSEELIESRMGHRDHFMPAELLRSQFDTLEPPTGVLELNVSLPIDSMVARIRDAFHLQTVGH